MKATPKVAKEAKSSVVGSFEAKNSAGNTATAAVA